MFHPLSRRAVLAGLLAAPGAQAQARPVVVASFSILGDMVRQLAGDRVRLHVLAGAGTDPHDFAPRPSDAALLADATLVVRNGLGFEPWLDRLLSASRPRGRVLVVSEGLDPPLLNRQPDPHAWMDLAMARRYQAAIAAALAAALPDAAQSLRAQADAADATLAALDEALRAALASLPPARRVVAVGHAALGWFGRAYGVEVLAPRGPGAASVAQLVQDLRARPEAPLFSTGSGDAALVRRVAAETGRPVRGRLYVETLSAPDGPAPDLPGLARYNTGLLLAAMRG